MGLLLAIARNLDAFSGPLVMLIYPLYSSIRTIESPSAFGDQQWLTYWVLYSLMASFELSFWKFLAWFPLWSYMKLLVSLWLVLPIFNGAAYIYDNVVRKQLKIVNRFASSTITEEKRKVVHMMSFDARRSVERYIDEYGTEAFETVLKAAEKEAKKHQS